MIEFIHAKINIGLYVTGKLPGGYHSLETLFYPIGINAGTPYNTVSFGDILESIPAESDSFTTIGQTVNCPEDQNLVIKALHLFKIRLKERGLSLDPLHLILEKHLPEGAGLGGGSADATATLKLLNKIAGEPFDTSYLHDMAASLGADCPFFLYDTPCIGRGIGDILTPFKINLKDKWLAIVKPNYGISTKEAFSEVTISPAPENYYDWLKMDPVHWKEKIENVFEKAFFKKHPNAIRIKEALYRNGALYASLSGSGSAFFGIFQSENEAQAGAEACGCEYSRIVKCER